MKKVFFFAVIFSGVLVAGCGAQETSPSGKPVWRQTVSPVVNEETHDLPDSDSEPLQDGNYWAEIARVQKSGDIIFQLYKARFGATCIAWAKENGLEESCMNDYSVENAFENFFVGFSENARVSVAQQDMPGKSYRITQADLLAAMEGQVEGAPEDYDWVPFPFLVHVANKEVVSAEQFWVP
jgi:hypothetical protein